MIDDDLDDLAPFWEEAVEAYERGCEHPLRLVPEKDQPRSAEDLLRLVEQMGGDFTSRVFADVFGVSCVSWQIGAVDQGE